MSEEMVAAGNDLRTRRAMLAGAGAVGASVVLAACGTDTSADGGGATSGGATSGGDAQAAGSASGAADGGGSALAQTSQVPEGGGTIIADQQVVITQPAAGEYKCFSAVCTHFGCPVSSVDAGTINCTCHNSKFSIEDGSVISGPAPGPLEEKNIVVEGENIILA